MSPLAGPYLAAVVVLAVAGGAKVARPDAARVALRTIGLPSSAGVVRAIGTAELVVAAWVVVVGGAAPAVVVGAAYLGFALVAQRLRVASDGQADCGCFGGSGTPVTRLHATINVVLAGVAFATLASPVPDLADALGRTPWAGLPFLVLVAVLASVVVVALTRAPGERSLPDRPLPATVTRHPAGAPGHVPGEPTGRASTIATADFAAGPAGDSAAGGPAAAGDLVGVDPEGAPITVPVAGQAEDTIVAFLSSTCVTCQTFWDTFAAPSGRSGRSGRRGFSPPEGIRLVVVTNGPEAERGDVVARLAPRHSPTVMATDAFARYQVTDAPSFVLLDGATGRVRARATGTTWDEVWAQLTAQASEPVPDPATDRDTV